MTALDWPPRTPSNHSPPPRFSLANAVLFHLPRGSQAHWDLRFTFLTSSFTPGLSRYLATQTLLLCPRCVSTPPRGSAGGLLLPWMSVSEWQSKRQLRRGASSAPKADHLGPVPPTGPSASTIALCPLECGHEGPGSTLQALPGARLIFILTGLTKCTSETNIRTM